MRFLFAAVMATALFCCQTSTGAVQQELSGGEDFSQCEDTCGPHGDKILLCHYPPGNLENPQTICVGSKLVPDHLIHGDSCGECVIPEPECGDDVCEAPEDCSVCSEDCGTCPPVCGDKVCEDTENCSLCAEDCGECPPVCGDQVCGEGENCEECAYDCGVCSPVCGDASCDEGESCENCEADCGECPECPPECGDQTCEDGESCSSCPRDCGKCEPVCGDSSCEGGEDCSICPTDCGVCPPDCGNEICEVGEDCETCAEDCGTCPPTCGDGLCEAGETCAACPGDCGQCTPPDAGPIDSGTEDPTRMVTGGEFGGCTTGGSNSGLLGLLIVGFGLLFMQRKKSHLIALIALASVLAVPTTATAQVVGDPGNFKLERFEAAMDSKSIITVEGGEVGPRGSAGLQFTLGYADDPLVLQEDSGDGFERVGSLVGHQLMGSLGGYLAFTDDLAFGVTLPMMLSQDRDAGELTGLSSLGGADISDVRLSLKYQIAEQDADEVNFAVGANATIPRASDADYLGSESATLTPYLALSENYGSWRWAFNTGIKLQKDADLVNLTVSDEMFARLGIAKGWGVNEVGVTVTSTTSASDAFIDNTSYSEAMAAYSRKYDNGLSSFIGTGMGLNQGFGAPDWRVFLGMKLDIDAKKPKKRNVVENVPSAPPEEEPAPPAPKVKIHVLTIPDAFFAFDEDLVLDLYRSKLKPLADDLMAVHKDHPEVNVMLVAEGHTDSIGSSAYNIDLGERRAKAVAKVLGEFGVPSDMIIMVSFGENKPVASNSTEEGRATNRRVDIYFSARESILDYYDFKVEDGKPDDDSTYDGYGTLKLK